MNLYKTKYLKYKTKYIQLKNQHGGTKEEIEKKIKILEPRCATTNFSQHYGECWNDTIQTLICFSDETKETVQNKLLNLTPREIINLAYFNKREKFLPPIYRRSIENPKQQTRAIKFEKRLEKYLTLLQQRLCMHIDGEKPICNLEDGSSCPIMDFNKYLVEDESEPEPETETEPETKIKATRGRTMKRKTPEERKRDSSIISGVGSAMIGNKITFRKTTKEKHGAQAFDSIIIFSILSFCLLDNNDIIIPEYKLFRELTFDDLRDVFAIYGSTQNHAIGFYTCNKENLYYNDNLYYSNNLYYKYLLNWKSLLNDYILNKSLIIYTRNNDEILLKNKETQTKLTFYGTEEYYDDVDYKPIKEDELIELLLLKKYEYTEENYTINENLNKIFLTAELLYGNLKNIDINDVIDKSFYNYSSILKYAKKNNKLFRKILKKVVETKITNEKLYSKILFYIFNDIDIFTYCEATKIIFENCKDFNVFDEKGNSLLLNMIISKNNIMTNLLIKHGADVNINNKIFSALYKATLNNDNAIIKLLLEYGAVATYVYHNRSVLYNVILNNNYEIAKLLLKKGADVNKGYYDDTPLNLAIQNDNYDIVKLLIDYGANVSENLLTITKNDKIKKLLEKNLKFKF